ncbi:homoserine dehydrogenase [Candidatus Aerophobetes bacterium]|nr:homoserine dehydrogenase [Candidatus Aerophobetes bacterium]
MQTRSVHIGIFGLGTVGGGIVELLRRGGKKNKDYNFALKKIVVKNLDKRRKVSVPSELLSCEPKSILDNPDIDTVVEVMGGIHPAQEIVLEALKKGKNVVTANKALLARVGSKIFEKALQNNCYLGVRASNIASYRLIESLTSSPSKMEKLLGIFNGTCNYILTEMEKKGEDFPIILKRAQEIGYAEPDPSDDIRGYDTAHKLIILLGLALGYFIPLESLYVEGIERISYQDILFTKELGYRIKLLAIAKKFGDELEARVHPALLPRNKGLARLEGIENGVEIKDEGGLGIRMQAPGAGKYPAAIAVMEDLICIAKGRKLFLPQEKISLILKPMTEIQTKYYLRFNALDKAGVLAKISNVLGNHNISIEAVLQKGNGEKKIKWVPIIMLTHKSREKDIQSALKQIDSLSVTKGKSLLIRVEEEIF